MGSEDKFLGIDGLPHTGDSATGSGPRPCNTMIANGIKYYSQWFLGRENVVANSLSLDNNLSDTDLTSLLCSLTILQVPQNIQIVLLPNKISYWLTSTLQQLPVKEQLREEHKQTKLVHENGGKLMDTPLESAMIHSSKALP